MIHDICYDCNKYAALFVGLYEHPNGERYTMALCDQCRPKHEQWRVNRVKL
jgi:hypothetical protein